LRAQTLADGSVVELNGDSRIEVDYSASERRVRLVSGEAHFVVAKNPGRPFFVSVGPVTVRAVGTAFNIRHSPAAIEVLVTEGTVRVEPAQPASSSRNEAVSGPGPALVAGQRALIEQNSESSSVIDVSEVGRSEIEEVMAWQGTRLVFSSTRLDEVVAAFNRYNRHRLTLGDPRLRERTLTGTFRADNLEGFLRLVRQMVDVKAEKRTAGETVLLPAT
jgi:transmembrane sensor